MKKGLITILVILFLLGRFVNLFSQCSHIGKKVFTESISPGFSQLELKYDVKYYHINIEASDSTTYINAFTDIIFHALVSIDTLVFELSNDLSIDSILLGSIVHNKFSHRNNLIYIETEGIIPGEEPEFVRIYYNGMSQSTGFFSGISNRKDNIYGNNVTYTLSEPFQASSWFPVKQDLRDKADSVRIYLTVEDRLMAGSNGVLEEIEYSNDGRKTFKWFSKYPIDYYLISFSVSNYLDYKFKVKIPQLNDSLLVQNYIYNTANILELEKEKIDKTGPLLKLFSELFGPYPFANEKYGHCMAPMGGGMEHQTMTTLQTFNFLLVAHELAHQWFGDYVTCSTWQDIWINEGFASYGEYLALEYIEGEEEAIEWMDAAHGIALNAPTGSIFVPKEESENSSSIFDYRLSYKKGAAIINMLRYELDNDEMFFQILKAFLEKHKYSVASGQNFLDVFNEISGQDFSWFFDQWYYGEGYPFFQLSYRSIEDTLFVESIQSGIEETDFFRTHFDLKIFFENGSDTIYRLEQDALTNKFYIPVSSQVVSVQIDPYSRLLMKSLVYEYLPEFGVIDVGPNPFNDKLHFIFNKLNEEKEVWISDMGGQILYNKIINPTSSYEIDLSFLSNGVYILTLVEGSNKLVKKVLKL